MPELRLIQGSSDGEDDDLRWQKFAACLNMDPDAFFPDNMPSKETRLTCLGCAVREECLEYALRHNEKHGVWGGMSERERRRIRRQRALKRAEEQST